MISIIDEFENQLQKDVKDDHINGSISAAIVKNNKMIWSKAFGPSNINGHVLANTQTIYRAGSIAKSFTAFLMMQLVQDGTIELDNPIELHFPQIRELEGYSDSTKITFRQLASHTSGLIREPKLEKADSGPIEEWENKVIQSIPTTSFENKPGEKFSYSNIGYGILGLALSRAANQPFIKMIEEKIFKPLKMENSFFVVPQHQLENLSQGIGGGPFGDEENDIEGPKNEHRGRGYKVPNGGIYSTPADLGKFLMSNLGNPNILDKKYLEMMHTNQTPEKTYHSYGLGFQLYQDPAIKIVEHSGGVLGYSAYFGFEKDFGYGVIIMRNYNWGTTNWDFGPKILLRKLVDFEKKQK
jgi:CubicO group peptidase (beta-lactamase class C family)